MQQQHHGFSSFLDNVGLWMRANGDGGEFICYRLSAVVRARDQRVAWQPRALERSVVKLMSAAVAGALMSTYEISNSLCSLFLKGIKSWHTNRTIARSFFLSSFSWSLELITSYKIAHSLVVCSVCVSEWSPKWSRVAVVREERKAREGRASSIEFQLITNLPLIPSLSSLLRPPAPAPLSPPCFFGTLLWGGGGGSPFFSQKYSVVCPEKMMGQPSSCHHRFVIFDDLRREAGYL